ncbi:MAG: hypothetical protein ISP82_05425 [Candidatus Poseidoniaceae archaeon]|nr:hypothetical protein [Candidatus Poseidoniaceae archaeon]
MNAGNLFTNQHRGKGMIAGLTALMGLWLSAAMWIEFNDALGGFFGPSMGVIIGTVVFLLYQTKKNERELTHGSSYTTSETTSLYRDETGRMQQVESDTELGRNPVLLVAALYGAIILLSELSWSNFF